MPHLTHLLADHLHGRTSVPVDADVASLVRLATAHQCAGIIYAQTKLPELQDAASAHVYHAATRRSQLAKIHDAFAAAGIDYLIFKGTEIAGYYPQPALRTMGDSDILVHPADKKRAGDVLLSLGMTNKMRGGSEWGYYWNGIFYELHSRLMSDEAGNLPAHKAFMAEHWNYASLSSDTQYRLDESYHFVYVILHLRKHFINSGVGFRQFMDVAVMRQKCELDWDFIEAKLTELGIIDFAKTCFALIERWFEVDFPFKAELDEGFIAEATEAVATGGVFGFDNEENKQNYVKLQMSRDKHHTLKNALSMAFPSYESLRVTADYEFIDGKPWLLPATWVYRFFTKIFTRRAKAAFDIIKRPFSVTDESISTRLDTLHRWGINEF